jgi:hypothetical protein
MDEAAIFNDLILGGGGAGGGLVAGYLIRQALFTRGSTGENSSLGTVVDKIDRTNELLTQLLIEQGEMKGLLAGLKRD